MKNKLAAGLLVVVALALGYLKSQFPDPMVARPVQHNEIQFTAPSTEGVRGLWISKTVRPSDPRIEGVRGLWIS